jgi:hypothetical protein
VLGSLGVVDLTFKSFFFVLGSPTTTLLLLPDATGAGSTKLQQHDSLAQSTLKQREKLPLTLSTK